MPRSSAMMKTMFGGRLVFSPPYRSLGKTSNVSASMIRRQTAVRLMLRAPQGGFVQKAVNHKDHKGHEGRQESTKPSPSFLLRSDVFLCDLCDLCGSPLSG